MLGVNAPIAPPPDSLHGHRELRCNMSADCVHLNSFLGSHRKLQNYKNSTHLTYLPAQLGIINQKFILW